MAAPEYLPAMVNYRYSILLPLTIGAAQGKAVIHSQTQHHSSRFPSLNVGKENLLPVFEEVVFSLPYGAAAVGLSIYAELDCDRVYCPSDWIIIFNAYETPHEIMRIAASVAKKQGDEIGTGSALMRHLSGKRKKESDLISVRQKLMTLTELVEECSKAP